MSADNDIQGAFPSPGPSKITGPDFLCIGMARSGTGWLSDQLKYHPDFWMPPVKEFGYLKRERPRTPRVVEKRLDRLRKNPNRPPRGELQYANRQPGDTRDIQFLEESTIGTGVVSYISLFRHKLTWLSGDITPGYCSLEPAMIAEIAGAMPDTKIILLVRDPVSRAWSHVCLKRRHGHVEDSVLRSTTAFREFIDEPRGLGAEPFPTKIVRRWTENAPNLSFRHFLFDDIAADPQKARSEILLCLGANPDKRSGDLSAGHNKKAAKEKLELTDGMKDVLVDFFRDELLACADYFGGAARDWPKKYGL